MKIKTVEMQETNTMEVRNTFHRAESLNRKSARESQLVEID